MSNPNKHKPLSAEELFKLLDNTSNKASDFDELDDFEREALEGFSAHSDLEKAKALTDELNLEISKKVTSTTSTGSVTAATKNRVIWFSAAASIVLIIMLSVFFFSQTKEDSQTNIALNEVKDNYPQQPQLEPVNPKSTTDNISKQQESLPQEPLVSQQTIVSKNAISENSKGLVTESSVVLAGAKPDFAYSPIAKDEAKSRSKENLDDKFKEGDNAAEKIKTTYTYAASGVAVGSVEKEKNKLEQTNNELQANQKIATNTSATKTVREEAVYKEDESIALADSKKKAEKSAKLFKESADMDKANAGPDANRNTASAPVSVSKNNNAYYVGSELAIRDYVLEFLAKKSGSVIITGKYKVSGNVSAKGELNIISIIQISNENCNCIQQIKEALNSMTKWNAAVEGEKNISSNVEFMISF